MATMMQTMHDPTYRARLEAKMGALKHDPELAGIMQELECGGPAAMMQCAPCHPFNKPVTACAGSLPLCALAAGSICYAYHAYAMPVLFTPDRC